MKDAKAKEPEILQAGKVFHELEGTEFYHMFRVTTPGTRQGCREWWMPISQASSRAEETRMKAAAQKEYENFNIRDYV